MPTPDPAGKKPDEPATFAEFIADLRSFAPQLAAILLSLPPDRKAAYHAQFQRSVTNPLNPADKRSETQRKRDAADFIYTMASHEADSTAKYPIAPHGHVCFSLRMARELCPADAIVYRFLQTKQEELPYSLGASSYVRQGLLWVPGHSAVSIHRELDCFKNAQTVLDAIDRLENEGLIRTERTGAFVEHDRRTKMRCDMAMWFHVPEPVNKSEPTFCVDCADALEHGLSLGMLVTLFRLEPETKNLYATDLAKRLPLTAETIRSLCKKLPKRLNR
jgi:hypothetical protein